MQKISNVSINAFLNGQPLTIQKDGYIGRPEYMDKIVIEAHVQPNPRTYAISVDGKKNITLKKNHASSENEDAIYRFETQVKIASHGGFYHVEYPENNMRLVRINPDGNVEIWQIALISQNNLFFVITEKSYDKCCFRNSEVVVCPQFKHRPKLEKFLKELLKSHLESLPDVKNYQKITISANGLKPGNGLIRWYNAAQGFGAIITPEGVARMHWEEIVKQGRLTLPEIGRLVKYSALREPKQTSSRNTSFEKEALDVTLL